MLQSALYQVRFLAVPLNIMDAILVTKPAYDLRAFLEVTHGALGYSPAESADACRRKLSDTERFISYLAAVRDPGASCGFQDGLLSHASFSVLLAAQESELLAILSCASGMTFVTANTTVRGISIAVLTGTLSQWKSAIADGLSLDSQARACYTKLYTLFSEEGINIWFDYKVSTGKDRYLLLTYKP